MKKFLNILSIAAAFTLTVPAFAKDAAKKEAPPAVKPEEKKAESKKDHYPLHGEVVAVTDTLLTIKGGKDKPDHLFDITKETKIHAGDKPATVKDIKVGQTVTGYIHKLEKGNPELVSLNVAPIEKKKDEKKEEEKKPATPDTKKKVK